MTEHITIKKITKDGKELIEMSFYGEYEVLFSMLYTSAQKNEILHDLIMDVVVKDMPPMSFDEINLN